MKKWGFLLGLLISIGVHAQKTDTLFTMQAVKSYPFPNELTAAPTGSKIAWAFNESGVRNIFVAEGPDFKARQLTQYNTDDGQELTSVSISPDGNWVVYVRGGDHGSNWDDHVAVNPSFSTTAPKVEIWSAPFKGGTPVQLGDGEEPVISSKGIVAFHKGGQIWTVPADGSRPAAQLFTARGTNNSPVWSPDGNRLAFQSARGDHAFIGLYEGADKPLRWIDPGFSRDASPRWSPDGTQLAFVRMQAGGGFPDSALVRHPIGWSIAVADAGTGQARTLWTAPKTLRGSVPTTHGSTNLHWAAGRIVFLSYHDGWPHLYSLPDQGGAPLLLTPGNYMAEYIRMSPDKRWMVFTANAGTDPLDIDRRHVVRVPVDRAAPEVMTPGSGLEWTPVVTGDGNTLAFIGATAQRPPLPCVMSFKGGQARILAEERIPNSFPRLQLVVPKQIKYQTPDGLTVHAQWFEQPGSPANVKKPAVIFVHGGPPRQMLLGWHYSDYYSNAYAVNQYLASRGFIVLSINYRLGIGYGYEFHQPKNAGATGASEYIDVKAAAEWLATQPAVDAQRIGIYGGSYGGFLTAMALARNSNLFAAGVDIHGVHDWTGERARPLLVREKYERIPDADKALQVAWESSPISSVSMWKSPVLIIHGDDDRNVRFSQSTDLVRRLDKLNVPMETLVIVDDTHHFMLHKNSVKVNKATADFLERKLKAGVKR